MTTVGFDDWNLPLARRLELRGEGGLDITQGGLEVAIYWTSMALELDSRQTFKFLSQSSQYYQKAMSQKNLVW